MAPDLFPLSPSESHTPCETRRWRTFFLRPSGALMIGFLCTACLLTSLVVHVAFFSPFGPLWRIPDWRLPPHHPLELTDSNEPPLVHPKPAPKFTPSPASDVLTLEQIRDIVAPTRGFFSRDYSVHLGWNNNRYIIEAALLQAELLNRTLVLPSFVYARACEYDVTVCADYATMFNKGDAFGSDQWRKLPIEQQMGFRIPISVIVNMTHLRDRQPVITASEYLRLHGQSPDGEPSNGFWPRQSYQTQPNVFETNKTKTPSLFVIENHWYDPAGTIRVDRIPEAMKWRGNLERHLGPENYDGGSTEYWPPLGPTALSTRLALSRDYPLDWDAAKNVLANSADLVGEGVNLNNDEAVEELLNAHGWEVLHTFPAGVETDVARVVIGRLKQVVQRSSIRGFKDDYYDVDADVVVLAGETHGGRKPGAMRFTEELARNKFTSMVMHALIPPQKVFDLAEILSSRMRSRTEGRMWMGAHMRRGDFVLLEWAMEMDPEAHIQRVKKHLQAGREVVVDVHHRRNWTTCDIEGVKLDMEQITLPPPHAEDPIFVATDERDPDARRKIAAAGAVFMSDLLTMEDRQAFGWPLMIMDVMALVEQQLLVHSGIFDGHCLSSFSGAIVNMRAARGADPRTMFLS